MLQNKKMNRLFKYLLGISTVLILIFSCTKEKSQENNQLPGVLNNQTGDCKSCTFYPWCDESTYTYVDTTALGTTTTDYNYLFLSDTTINGVDYKVTDNGAGEIVYHNCTDNNTTFLTYDFGSDLVFHTALKESLPVGGNWLDYFPGNPIANSTQYKITNKSITRNVNGNLFVDVTVVQERSFLDTVLVTNTNVYYARGVGEVERIVKDSAGVQLSHRILTNYRVP